MAIAQTKKPYEFLARWDDAGVLKGAHVVFREAITDADVEISSKIGDTMPVAVGGQQGFPLADILSTLHADALADVAVKTAELSALTTEKATLTTEKAAAVAAREAADAQVATLTAAAAAQATATAAEKATTAEGNTTAVTALTTEKAALVAAHDAAVAQVATLTAQVAALTAQVTALQPPAPVNGVPQVVTMVQAQLALLKAGLLDQVNTAIAAIPGDQGRAAQIEWASATSVHRVNPLIAAMQTALSLTDAQIDALFVAAALL